VVKGRIDIGEGTIIALVIFILIAIFVRGRGPEALIIAMLSVATFLFGIFGAFVMQNRHKRLDELRSTMRKDDANYVALYKLSSVFGEKIQAKLQKLIDDYFMATIDYSLNDYHKSAPAFLKLYDFILSLKPKTAEQKEAYDKLLGILNSANESRKYTEFLVKNTMFGFKWLTLVGLLAVILFSVFYINNGSIPSIIITVLLATASVMLLLLIRDLDSLYWKEQKWMWDPLQQVFTEMDLLPYYADDIIKTGRVKLEKGAKVRIAHYPHPYPDISGKTVKTVVIK